MILLLSVSGAFSAEHIVPHEGQDGIKRYGHTSFRGQVLHSACTLTMDNIQQTVDMGSVKAIPMNAPGPEKTFFLQLKNCDVVGVHSAFPGSRIRMTFDGLRGKTPERFGLTGAANGAEVQIRDAQGDTALPGSAISPQLYTAHEQQFGYTLQLIPHAETPSADSYRAALRLKVDYE